MADPVKATSQQLKSGKSTNNLLFNSAKAASRDHSDSAGKAKADAKDNDKHSVMMTQNDNGFRSMAPNKNEVKPEFRPVYMNGRYGTDYDIFPINNPGYVDGYPSNQDTFKGNHDSHFNNGLGYASHDYMGDQGYQSDEGYMSDQPVNGESPHDNDVLFDESKFDVRIPTTQQKSNKDFLKQFDFHVPGEYRHF